MVWIFYQATIKKLYIIIHQDETHPEYLQQLFISCLILWNYKNHLINWISNSLTFLNCMLIRKKWLNVKSEKLPRFTRWVDSKLKQVIILSSAQGESKHETTS